MRKKILILGHKDATQFIDVYNQYARLFAKDKYEVTIAYLTGKPKEEVIKRTLADNVIFFNIPKKNIRALKITAIFKLLTFCRQQKFHIVICHRYKPTYIMMWVAHFCKIPALLFVMHELKTMSSRGRQLFIACLQKKNMLFAGVSNAVRDDMRKDLWGVPKERIVTLHNMIDFDLTMPQLFSREEAREQLNIPDNTFLFGNLARLAPNKDQKTLINAFAQIKSRCPQAKLIIIGKGELESELKKIAASNHLENDVIFTGFLPLAYRYLRAFDCFTLSSKQEAFGRVLLEAMIAKLPIIATKVNGIPEVVAETGLLIEAQDVSCFAEAMEKIYQLSQNERKEQGEKAYKHAQNNFSIPAFQTQFWALPLFQAIKEST